MKDEKKAHIPRGQIAWEYRYDINGNLRRVVTSNETNTKWYLYEVDKDGKLIKEQTGNSPAEFPPECTPKKGKGKGK